MKLQKIIFYLLTALILTSCDPEGIHVGHVRGCNTSAGIQIEYHDIDAAHTWVDGYSKSRTHKILSLEYESLSSTESLVVVGNFDQDIIYEDTVINSDLVPFVSKHFMEKYEITKVNPEDETPFYMILLKIIGWIIGVSVLVSLITKLFDLLGNLKEYIIDKNGYNLRKKDILGYIKMCIEDSKTYEPDKLRQSLYKSFDKKLVDEVLDEINNDLNRSNE